MSGWPGAGAEGTGLPRAQGNLRLDGNVFCPDSGDV